MQELDYKKDSISDIPVSIALGFFDSVHLGHRSLIKKSKDRAAQSGWKSAVLTFRNNPNKNLQKNTDLIYTYEERLKLLQDCGIDIVISSVFDDEYMQIPALEFLKHLTSNFSIAHIVCGKDYKFGHFGRGTTATLEEFCGQNGIELEIVEDVFFDGIKVSTTLIREHLQKGDIIAANNLLSTHYFIDGTVVHGNKMGTRLLFPTANMEVNSQKIKIGSGVYLTAAEIDGKRHLSVTNCGNKPTFNDSSYKIETHILKFAQNLYGKKITVHFLDKLREIQKFTDVQALRAQIQADIAAAKNSKYKF